MTDALQQYLDSVRAQPFAWGVHDCAMFAARAADATHGTLFVDAVQRFNCRSARDYRRMQREGATLKALTIAELGEPITQGAVSRGDVALVRVGTTDVLGVVAPPVVLVATAYGFAPVAFESIRCAWRIA